MYRTLVLAQPVRKRAEKYKKLNIKITSGITSNRYLIHEHDTTALHQHK